MGGRTAGGRSDAGPVVFAIHDGTTYRNLQPVAAALPSSVDVEYLLLDDLFGDHGVPADDLRPHRRATDYVRGDWVVGLNERSRPGALHLEAVQRFAEDLLSPRLSYRIDEYLADANPRLVVCGHDRLPFVKHVLRRCHAADVPTAVVQHGIQRLEHLPANSRLVDALRPDASPRFQRLEDAKRRLLHPYGAYIFCSPYVDAVYAIGDFFADRIRERRAEYPCSGRGTVETTGYPEYGLTEVEPYDPTVESAVFLSGWEYELGEWGADTEARIAQLLRGVAATNDLDVVVRPHPKDTASKIERFYDDFEVSRADDLATDVERHDLALTVYSTALFLAAARGTACGVLRIPWERNRFGPFEDPHVLEIDEQRLAVRERAAERSTETQRRYLREYCYVPTVHGDEEATPAERVASKLRSLGDLEA